MNVAELPAAGRLPVCYAPPLHVQHLRDLTSFPGVGMVSAATILAEDGDFTRFTHRKTIGRYAGLSPRVYASGGKQRTGHIARTGPPDLRWILQQSAWTAIRADEQIRVIHHRIAKRSCRNAASVAIEGKLLTWMWHAVLKRETYQCRLAAA